jgi:tetratricopeptide (TPR) repeat protein
LRAALAVQPGNARLRRELAVLLEQLGQLEEAVALNEDVLRDKPGYAMAHNSLGWTYYRQGRPDQAELEYRQAIRLDPTVTWPHINLGYLKELEGQLDEALANVDRGLQCDPNFFKNDPNFALAHATRGYILVLQQKPAEAEDAARTAIRLDPELAVAYNVLGLALQGQDKFDDALTAYQTAVQKDPGYTEARNHLRKVPLDRRLPDFLSGKDNPKDAEKIDLARLCSEKRLYRPAVRFFEAAFAAQPQLTEDLQSGDRYDAARAACLAANVIGGDATGLDDAERARLREQALVWLRADLDLWNKRLDTETPNFRKDMSGRLHNWRRHADLASVRDAVRLAKLPAGEREAWFKLWEDVDAALRHVNGHHPGP